MAVDPITAAKIVGTVVEHKEDIAKTFMVILCTICLVLVFLTSIVTYLLAAPMEVLNKYFSGPLERGALAIFRATYSYILNPDYSGSFDTSYSGDYPFPVPVLGITSDYGWRTHPTLGFQDFHNGLDIVTEWHSPIKAIDNGKVAAIGIDKFFGRYVMLEHQRTIIVGYETITEDDPDYDPEASNSRPITELETFYSFYAHMAAVDVVCTGQEIQKGLVIGLVGGDPKKDPFPGESTGAHLHFGIYHGLNIFSDDVDPREYITNQKEEKS